MGDKPPDHTDQTLDGVLKELEEIPFGVITERGYKKIQEQIQTGFDRNDDRFHRWLTTGLVAFSLIALSSTVALAGFGVLLARQSTLTNEIQMQRYGSVLDACLDQNIRHDKVIKAIDDAVAAVPPPPEEQQRARESAKPFKLILEAAVPHTDDCREVARQRVEGEGR